MTENTPQDAHHEPVDTPTAAPQAPDAENTPQDPSADPANVEDGQEEADPARKARAEARNLRGRLRDTEQANATLTAQVEALGERVAVVQRSEIERLATTAGLAAGADLWLAGTQLSDLLDDDGNIDPDKVSEATSQVLAAHPGWGPQPPRMARKPVSHLHSGASPIDLGITAPTSWKDVLRG